jgi:hypothetical protein
MRLRYSAGQFVSGRGRPLARIIRLVCRQSGSWDGTIAKFRVRCDPGRTRDGVHQFAYGGLKFLHIS